MTDKIIFVEMKEKWERDYVQEKLQDVGPVAFEDASAQDVLDRLSVRLVQ